MQGGLSRLGRWSLGAGLLALVAFAHAQPPYVLRGGWVARAPAVFAGGQSRAGGYDAAVMRVAGGGGWGARGSAREPERDAYGGGAYRDGPFTPVSAEGRQAPHTSADSPMRTGSIREDVARYNEERGALRAPPRAGEVPRPPMPSPYRN